jgi:hypothetical protein
MVLLVPSVGHLPLISGGFYSGHKKVHAFKFQGIMTPDGIVSSLAGPVEGPVGDWKLFKDLGIENVLRALFSDVGSSQWLHLLVTRHTMED